MILIDQIINSNYIKYDRLSFITNLEFKGSTSTTLDIYIDLYSILKRLYNNKNYSIDDYSSITSCIINMVAHYRNFFRTRYGVETNFYIVYSKNCSYINSRFYIGYNEKNQYMFSSNKIVNDMINNNIKLLEILCPYLPNIYFINGTFETGVIIYDLICGNEIDHVNTPSIIVTKDVYNYQLVAMRDNINILRPKKMNGTDSSYYINKNNLLINYLSSRNSNNIEALQTLMPGTLSLLMTMSSVKERNIKTLLNIQTAIKLIKKSIDECKILNGYNNIIEDIWNIIDNKKINISQIEFVNRFKAIDIQSQHLIYINNPENLNIKLLDLYDPENVKAINNKYFKNNPLDLMSL